ncbi:unnamed protein product [Ilex paraguariensis]|uniref:DUF7722 domain-containing protein n=1 Tax=Ilex paraguariensis TaxID=185542 RepID=A0ABC8U281_9AQUA
MATISTEIEIGIEIETRDTSSRECFLTYTVPGGRQVTGNEKQYCTFRMPLHYPSYKKTDYENMSEWKLDCLLKEYGLPVIGDVNQKRKFAMGAFLWPDQYE